MSATADSVKTDDKVTIEIDGIAVKVRRAGMIIEAADAAGISIPRFCYHKKLSVSANCRMCMVEVDKVPKPLPACATPVSEGMKVTTQSALALEAQKAVMEFLLINHPLDCPICDQGGECDLQEISIGYGGGSSSYAESKRIIKDEDIGPLIATEMTRCIHCTRCVRFGDEIAGIRELGAVSRGENMKIGTYIEGAVTSEMSGNVIDLCPVGALTSKPFQYRARAWEMTARPSISAHDSVGSNIMIQTRNGQVMRVDPDENESINEIWISDRDRYSYEGLASDDRLLSPKIKENGVWRDVDWNTALQFAVTGLKGVIGQHGVGQLGALASPSLTLEEMYLYQALIRGIGSANIDYRTRQQDFSDQELLPVFSGLSEKISKLSDRDTLLIVGSNIRKDQPMICHRVRKAQLRGADISVLNPIDYDFNFDVKQKMIVRPDLMHRELALVVKAASQILKQSLDKKIDAEVSDLKVEEDHLAIAKKLIESDNATILLGNYVNTQKTAGSVRFLASSLAKLTSSSLSVLDQGANSIGANLTGLLPHRSVAGKELPGTGLHARAIIDSKLKAYVLFNVEPESDCVNANTAVESVNNADFVVCLNPYFSNEMEKYANVVLPISSFAETSGTYINCENTWQSFEGAAKPVGESRPGWKVLRVLGNLFDIDDFDFSSSVEIRDRVKSLVNHIEVNQSYEVNELASCKVDVEKLVRIADVPIYAVDGTVRRSKPLQETVDASLDQAVINNNTAEKLKLSQDDMVTVKQVTGSATLPLRIDEKVPDFCVYLPYATKHAQNLGLDGDDIELVKAG